GFFHDALHTANFVNGAGKDGGVMWGAMFDVLTGLTGIGTAVALYPFIKRHGPGRAVGFVASRTLEAAMLAVGAVAVLALFTLRHDYAGATGVTATSLTTAASSLVAVKNWTFLFGPGVMPAINAICFASIMYQSRLVPRWIPTVGLIGVPLLLISSTASLFGAWDQSSSTALFFALPIATWELSVGLYMTFKGFRKVAGSTTGNGNVPTEQPALVTV
ncbi:MAG: DUF4386 domain-containing protein, partial [Frankiaceae bacterium]|nr:DUF4386 domain-containing protein [Frankiaceae bacterium]